MRKKAMLLAIALTATLTGAVSEATFTAAAPETMLTSGVSGDNTCYFCECTSQACVCRQIRCPS